MSDAPSGFDPNNFIHQYLRRLDQKVDRLTDDVKELKLRVSGVEQAVAIQSSRIDRVELRLERIERRLDLVETPSP